jgi:hypothetical protein
VPLVIVGISLTVTMGAVRHRPASNRAMPAVLSKQVSCLCPDCKGKSCHLRTAQRHGRKHGSFYLRGGRSQVARVSNDDEAAADNVAAMNNGGDGDAQPTNR